MLGLTVNAGNQSAGNSPRWNISMASVSANGLLLGMLRGDYRQRYMLRLNVHGERIRYSALICRELASGVIVDGINK